MPSHYYNPKRRVATAAAYIVACDDSFDEPHDTPFDELASGPSYKLRTGPSTSSGRKT